MKKLLLSMAVVAMTVAAHAITTDEAAQMTLRLDFKNGIPQNTSTTYGKFAQSSTEGMWEIENFYNNVNLKLTIAEDGSVMVPAQTLGGDNSGNYYLIVPAELADKTPAELAPGCSITGTYADSSLSLDAWNIIVVNPSFTDNLGTKFNGVMTTTIAAPNANVSRGMWMADINEDTDRFQGWEMNDPWPNRHAARVDVNGDQLTIGNFLGMWTECPTATFDLDLDAKTITFHAEEIVVQTASGNLYTIFSIPDPLVEEHQAALEDVPVVGTISDDLKTITIKNFCVMRFDEMFRNVDYCHGSPVHTLVITLDEPLSGGQDAIRGDVNNDGTVDIADVNIIINIMLGNDDAANYDGRANLTSGDNVVDIADVNEAINIMLGKYFKRP